MITKDNMVYILKRTELKNITEHQLEEFISEFDLDDKGNVLIPYQHKGYTCNDKMDLFINSDIQAISFFSGCGGLDIGTQLAGVKVLSSLDFYEDSVNSLRKNPFFSHSEHFCENITVPKEAYPDGLTVLAPIETWSDDFSIAISGIPSTVNDFSAGPFMETHYHSQYDNEEFYQEAVYRFHHELYTRLLVTLDQLTLPPLDFSRHFLAMKSSVADCLAAQSNAPAEVLEEIPALLESISKVCESADLLYEKIQEINNHTVSADFPMVSGLSSKLLHIFRKMQDYFVRLDWQDAVCFPHAAASQNLCHLEQAVHALESQNITAALEALYEVDNNCYAFLFDEEVYYHFTEYILHQPKDRLMWGAGRILHHENLYGLVQRLKELDQMAIPGSLDVEIRRLEAAIRRQQAYLKDDLHYMKQSVDKIQALINDCLETSSHYNKEKNGENQ